MNSVILIFLWVIGILSVTSVSAYLGKRFGIEFLIGTVVALIVVANAIANKIIVIGPLTMTASVVAYSMIFLVSDLIAEVWGKKMAHKAVWAGFFGVVIFVVVSQVALHWTPAEFAVATSDGFNLVFGTSIRVAVGSMLAYIVSQHYDVFAYTYIKERTGDKFLWLRNNLSTISSQLVSTIIFIMVAFYGILPVIPLIIGQWVVKSIIAIIDTPFLYLMRHIVKITKIKEEPNYF